MNPFTALAEYALGRLKQAAIAQWWKLLFEMTFSGVVSYLTVCGTTLILSQNALVSRGGGMVAAAVSLTVLFRRSPLTKGLMVVLPAEEAAKEFETQTQVITRN